MARFNATTICFIFMIISRLSLSSCRAGSSQSTRQERKEIHTFFSIKRRVPESSFSTRSYSQLKTDMEKVKTKSVNRSAHELCRRGQDRYRYAIGDGSRRGGRADQTPFKLMHGPENTTGVVGALAS